MLGFIRGIRFAAVGIVLALVSALAIASPMPPGAVNIDLASIADYDAMAPIYGQATALDQIELRPAVDSKDMLTAADQPWRSVIFVDCERGSDYCTANIDIMASMKPETVDYLPDKL